MKKRKIAFLMAAVLGICTALSACGSDEKSDDKTVESEDTAKKDTIKIAYSQEPASLDPNNSSDGASKMVNWNIYEGLLKLNDQYEPEPCLAESYEMSEDGLTYIFKLRQDVTFQNGEPFDAEDVKYSFDRCMASNYVAIVSNLIESTTIIDEYTVEVKLKEPYAPMLQAFGSEYLKIVNEKAVEEAGDAFSYAPGGAGTGPYEFVSWSTGEKIQLKANENYWGGAPEIANVEILFMTDAVSRVMAFENGDIDFVDNLGVQDIASIEANDAVDIKLCESITSNYIGFSCGKAPFDNPKVREAVAYCIDKQELLIASQNGEEGGKVMAVEIWEGQPGYDESLELYPKDIEKAKELLKEAGYESGFECTIYTPENSFRKNIATYLQSGLTEIGINAEIVVMQQAALLEEIKQGNCDIFIMGFSTYSKDPDMYLYNQYHTGEYYNYFGYSNTELDGLLEQARVSTDFDERDQLYKEASQIIYQEVPAIPNYFINKIFGISADLNYEGEVLPYLDASKFSWK